MTKGVGGHHSPHSGSDEWLTPPVVLAALGPFDLDPCACAQFETWTGCKTNYTYRGLDRPWEGRVWMNPPYSDVERWMARLAAHNDGIALVFARTETRWWHESVWPMASAILFLRGRLTFSSGVTGKPYLRSGRPGAGPTNSGGPSALVAYGGDNAAMLATGRLQGALVLGHGTMLVGEPARAPGRLQRALDMVAP